MSESPAGHTCTHRLHSLSCANTLLKPLLETLRQASGNEGLEKICPDSGPHKSPHLHTHPLSPDPARPARTGVLKSKRAGRETARVATPDAWELLPPPLQISSMASRAGPWGAGSSATTEEPLCLVAELGLLQPCDVVGGLVRRLPCWLSTSEKPGRPNRLACALLRKLRPQRPESWTLII